MTPVHLLTKEGSMAKSSMQKAGEIGGVAVVGGGIAYALYETYLFTKYHLWKRKSASNTMTFTQWKVTKPS
jgi:hypothetical protein